MNKFGGQWTLDKIKIVEEYAQAYLTIMNKYSFELTYFDGFAGTGSITLRDKAGELFNTNQQVVDGMAKAIFNTKTEKNFDIYYFVELDKDKCTLLGQNLKKAFPDRKIYAVDEDCNNKLKSLCDYITSDPSRRCLAFIDPFGMNLDFKSLEQFKNTGIDMWILVPTGLGAGRMLKKDGDSIPEGWFNRLESFFGVTKEDITSNIYHKIENVDLFGNIQTSSVRQPKVIKKISGLYEDKLKTIFKYVSEPYEMRNSMNSTMYHFYLVSNYTAAVTIANDIVRKYKQRK